MTSCTSTGSALYFQQSGDFVMNGKEIEYIDHSMLQPSIVRLPLVNYNTSVGPKD